MLERTVPQDSTSSGLGFSLLSSEVPDNFASGEEPTSQPGRSKGLVVLLDSHSDVLSEGSVDSDFDGFLGVINPSGSFPFTSYSGFDIRPGDSLEASVLQSVFYTVVSIQLPLRL